MEKDKVVSLEKARKRRKEDEVYQRWLAFYAGQPHDELLSALVFEHENGFPLRGSSDMVDQMKHKALVKVLDDRAQTQFLKNFLAEVSSTSIN